TSKGQVTIPKDIREHLGIGRVGKVIFETLPGQKTVMMRSVVDFLKVSEEVSKTLKRMKKMNPTKARG
ncbi:MAG: AbrB/MazE/SpoVT family DNA-binding domain-containing protein, partial [Patescibacteria group bacterium]